MTERMPWFPCEPAKLLGALAQMRAPEGYVYVTVLLRIYDVGGPCRDSLDALALRTKLNKRIVSEALDALFKAGKLVRVADGIMNPYASTVIEEAAAFRRERQSAGRKGAAAAHRKPKENQSMASGSATEEPVAKSGHLHLHVQSTLFPDGNRAPEAPPDERTKLFRGGLETLVRITGRPPDRMRKLIGKWLRDANEDALAVRRVIEDAEVNRVADPIPWIEKAIAVRRRGAPAGGQSRNGMAALVARMQENREDPHVEDAVYSNTR